MSRISDLNQLDDEYQRVLSCAFRVVNDTLWAQHLRRLVLGDRLDELEADGGDGPPTKSKSKVKSKRRR